MVWFLLLARPKIEIVDVPTDDPPLVDEKDENKVELAEDPEVSVIISYVETVVESVIYEENVTLNASTTVEYKLLETKWIAVIVAGFIILGAAIIVFFVLCRKRCPGWVPCLA